jgi:RNA polymerase sigma-70 factor (ECF subfamily)
MPDATTQIEQLYRELAPALLTYFRRQPTLGRSAEDLVQDTFVRAIRSFPRLHASTSPRAYLFGIARHVSLDALRSHHATEELSVEPAATEAPPVDDRLLAMRAAIGGLPETHREPLQLKLQHELSYAEIAEVLHIPIGTVRSRLHHAIARLRDTLNASQSAPRQPPSGQMP